MLLSSAVVASLGTVQVTDQGLNNKHAPVWNPLKVIDNAGSSFVLTGPPLVVVKWSACSSSSPAKVKQF